MAPLTRSASILLLGVAALAQSESQPAAQKSPPPKRQATHSDNLPQGEKFQISEIVTLLRSVRSGRLKQARLIEAIQTRGIAFPPSELNLARLMNSGAAEPVLEAIERLNVAQLPVQSTVEPPKPTYTLVVTCEPAECETRVGDQEFRESTGGKAAFNNLPSGRIILDSKKAGFEMKTEVVALDPANLPPSGTFLHSVALAPTLITQNLWGASLLGSLLAKAKVPAGPAVIAGTLTVTGPESTEWGITAHLSGNGASSLDVESGKGKASYLSSAGFWQVKPSRKSPFHGTREEKAKAESTLLRNMDIWIAYECFGLICGLSRPGVIAKSLIDPTLAGEAKELEIHTPQGWEAIGLNSDLQPSTISIPNSTGASVPARIEFSDYRQMGGGIYPGRTVIKFADSADRTLVFTVSRFEEESGALKSNTSSPKQ